MFTNKIRVGRQFLLAFSVVALISAQAAWAKPHKKPVHHEPVAEKHAEHEAASEHHGGHDSVAAEPEPEHTAPAKTKSAKSNWQLKAIFSALFAPVMNVFWNPLMEKLEEMQHLDEHNLELRTQVAALQIENLKLESELYYYREGGRAARMKMASKHEGGAEASRTIASLQPADHGLLSHPPRVVYEKAMQAFRDGDDETAARGLVYLADNEENSAFKTVETYFFAGVSLYKLGNYKQAMSYLTRASANARGSTLSYAPRAMSWMVLCEQKLGNHSKAKNLMHELMQKYPKSKEAQRLNRHA